MIHEPLIAGAIALFSAQALKTITNVARERRFNFRVVVGTGGMPSSHTALVVSLTTAVGLAHGFDTPLFDVSAVFSSIVMYDATGVRQAAGKQAAILNKMMEELSTMHSIREERLKELLGHTRLEVLGGAIYGIIVALLVHYGW
ncbi:MAG TPA: divergent PAP2 family protein [Oscillatoriaceae cyanobacterium]